MEIGEIIAYNLKKLREEQNLSQGQLAERAGVSKVIISQIEKGDSNPTINTIWKLTSALGLPYTSLLEMEEPRAVYVKKKERSEISEGKYHIYNYYPKNAERNFEVYQIEMDAGCDHTSVGHCANSFEYLVLTDGKITISLNEKDYILEKDDALYFDASQPHRYKNEEASSAKMTMVIQYLYNIIISEKEMRNKEL